MYYDNNRVFQYVETKIKINKTIDKDIIKTDKLKEFIDNTIEFIQNNVHKYNFVDLYDIHLDSYRNEFEPYTNIMADYVIDGMRERIPTIEETINQIII